MRYLGTLLVCLMTFFGNVYTQTVFEDYQDGRIYVKMKTYIHPKTGEVMAPNTQFSAQELPFYNKLNARYGVTKAERAFKQEVGAWLNSVLVLEFSSYNMVNQLIADLQGDAFVEFAEKIPLDRPHVTPNDSRFENQWNLEKINAVAAWSYANVGSNIVIAIVDDAVDRFHPDLAPNIWVNPGEIAGNGIDDDGNGYVDDVYGWDVVNNGPNVTPPTPEYDHGTHVAGIASAATNNEIGIASIGFSCKLMCVKAAGNDPRSIAGGYQGITYAANSGAHIINMSWGGGTASVVNQEVVAYAQSKGCILVSSAGNGNVSTLSYPATYPGVVSVASTTIDDTKSGFSHYGEWVTISAPGTNIISTLPGNTYGNKSGTSMASPMVAGLLGLMKTLNPGMPNQDLINCLRSSATNINAQNPAFNFLLGAGRINAAEAMNCVAATLDRAPVPNFDADVVRIVQGGSVQFRDLSNYNPTGWQWTFTGGTPATFSGKVPPRIVYNTPGEYAVALTASNANGSNTETKAMYITVDETPSCVSINYPKPQAWSVINYLSGAQGVNGFANGVNSINDRQKAMFFDLSASSSTGIVSLYLRFGRAATADPAKKVPVRFFDGTNDVPGNELGMYELTMAEIIQDVKAEAYTEIDLPKNILLPASKKFFISIDLSNLVWTESVKDSLSINSNLGGQTQGTNVWTQTTDGVWRKYGTTGTWPFVNLSFYIHPVVTSRPAIAMFTPQNSVICAGTSIELNATGSSFSGGLQWSVPGATPPTIIEGNQQIINPFYNTAGSYKVYLRAIGGCQEERFDSTTITVNATPDVEISASKNPICLGETTTLTASGASGYVWSPGATLNNTTGATVQATPANTTNYTVAATLGNCTIDVPFEVEVRERTADVTLVASEIMIVSTAEVTFTASATNGGLNPVYNFKLNGTSVQTGNSNILVRTVAVADRIECDLTSSEPCVDDKTVASNAIIMGSGTLPVNLISFTGKRIGNVHQLDWATAQEINAARFEIERSSGGNNFTKIGSVAAAGNSVSTISYTYTDAQPVTGNNYYRLKLLDRDGSAAYSNVILISADNLNLLTSLYPNPTLRGGSAVLNLSGAQQGRLQISIINATGQVISARTVVVANGSSQVPLGAAQMSAGAYIILVKNDHGKIIDQIRWMIY